MMVGYALTTGEKWNLAVCLMLTFVAIALALLNLWTVSTNTVGMFLLGVLAGANAYQVEQLLSTWNKRRVVLRGIKSGDIVVTLTDEDGAKRTWRPGEADGQKI